MRIGNGWMGWRGTGEERGGEVKGGGGVRCVRVGGEG